MAVTLYGTPPNPPLPISLICTAVSWHALISVLVGWHMTRIVLRRNSPWQTLALSTGIGLFWGCWAPLLWHETPPISTPLPSFLLFGCVATALLTLSYWFSEQFGFANFKPTKLGFALATLVIRAFFVMDIIALRGLPLLILPPLLIAATLALRRDQKLNPNIDTPLATAQTSSRNPSNYLLLMLALFVATGVCALAKSAGSHWPPIHSAVYPITIGVGTLLLCYSLARLLISRRKESEP